MTAFYNEDRRTLPDNENSPSPLLKENKSSKDKITYFQPQIDIYIFSKYRTN